MGVIKNYGKKSSKMIKLAVAIKGLSATLGVSAFAMSHEQLAFGILIAGAVANEVINFINHDDAPKDAGQ